MHRISTFIFLFVSLTATAQLRQPPKLAVGIVVDQMRYHYLTQYWEKFSEGGFKRLVNNGMNFENTHYNYVPTFTGPGHASVYTGTTPAHHGIVSNDWYSREEGKSVYCAQDGKVQAVGGHTLSGGFSPRRLKASTVTDELRLHSQLRSKVVGIAIKDRGAILPAGHTPNAAYWLDLNNTGNWMTSNYYMPDLPQWVKDFNQKGLAQMYLSMPWETLLPTASYTESDPDDSPYEGKFKGEEKPVFPHDLPKITEQIGIRTLAATPYGNTYTKEFAKAAILGEQLGKDNYPDILALSFSSTDYIGHQFGTNAVETQDAYLRLDRDIADLLSFLDMQVGKDKYVVFLTGDHGGAYNVPFLQKHQIPAQTYNNDSVRNQLQRAVYQKYKDSLVLHFMNNQVYLDEKKIAAQKLDLSELEDFVAEAAYGIEGVSQSVTAHTLQNHHFTDGMLQKVQLGYKARYSGNVMLVFEPGWMDYGNFGTTHGTSYTYDTHVPNLWFGAGIPKGRCSEEVHITDIAPTLALLLNVPFPNASSGKPLNKYWEQKKTKK